MAKDKKIQLPDMERRFIPASEFRVEGFDQKQLVGYAAMFNKLSSDLGYFREQIAPGAFTQAILNDDVRALVDHDSSRILGRNTAGTLRLKEDDKGLFTEIDVPDTTVGRDALVSVNRGDISGMSFAFRTIKDSWDYGDEDKDETPIRTLLEVNLYDVSIVTYPAYPDTTVGVRSLNQWLEQNQPKHNAIKLMNMNIRLAEATAPGIH